MSRSRIVVPCYNEAQRLRPEAFASFVERNADVDFLMVDDGSTDGTRRVLAQLAKQHPARIRVIERPGRGGKAAAVRDGMQRALASGADHAGYWDADLATPLEAIPDFAAELDAHPELELVLGARVQLLGRSISRNPWRHYLGRMFATAVSQILGIAVYDSQCGAKLFRASDVSRRLFAEPFTTGWIFDVEILARLVNLQRAGDAPAVESLVCELPLHVWQDVPGSKVRWSDAPRAAFELARIYRHYFR